MSLVIWTDGSIWPNPGGPGGWAFVAVEDGEVVHTASGGIHESRKNTNNTMEIRAVLEALLWADGRRCEIVSDSQYVVNGLNVWMHGWAKKGWKKPYRNKAKWQRLYDIVMSQRGKADSGATFRWVRGHDGEEFNEVADELAEAGRLAVT